MQNFPGFEWSYRYSYTHCLLIVVNACIEHLCSSKPFGAMTKVPASNMFKKKSSTELNLMFSYSSENSTPNMNMLLQSVCMHPDTYGYLHQVCAHL